MKRTLSELNALPAAEFTALFGGIYEHSPWIAAAAAELRPFPEAAALRATFRRIVDQADEAARLALIRAHPDLGGKLAQAGQLTPESTREQAAAGLESLSANQKLELTAANDAYRAKFGFPFIICARRHGPDSIMNAIQNRLTHTTREEQAAAMEEIHTIAQLRLEDLICQEN